MGRKNYGSVQPVTSKGKTRYRVRVTINGRQETIGYFDTAQEAVDARAAALVVVKESDYGPDVLLRDACEQWLTRRELSRLIADPDSDWSRFNHHIKDDPIGSIGVRAIRRYDIKDWVDRTRRKIAAQTTRNALQIIRGALETWVDKEVLKANPARDISVPEDKSTEEAWTFLTPDEQHAIIEAIDGPDRWIVAFAIGTGLRAGELCALRKADVHQTHVVVRYGGIPNMPTKNGRIREVPLFGLGALAVEEWLEQLDEYTGRSGNPHKLMFPGRHGAFRSDTHVLRWEVLHGSKTRVGAYADAGIERHVRWHDLRHTCASSLVSGWWGRRWSLEEVCAMLGHSDIKVTQRYAHLADTALKSAARETHATWISDRNQTNGGVALPHQGSGIIQVPPTGIGPATNGLGNRGDIHNYRKVEERSAAIGLICEEFLRLVAEAKDTKRIGEMANLIAPGKGIFEALEKTEQILSKHEGHYTNKLRNL